MKAPKPKPIPKSADATKGWGQLILGRRFGKQPTDRPLPFTTDDEDPDE